MDTRSNIILKQKPEMLDAMRSPLPTKHINDSIFIVDLSRWCPWYQYNITLLHIDLGLWCLTQQYISYIMAVNFIGGENRSTWRKPPTCRKSL